MLTLQTAPSRRKRINWYRVIPWVLLAIVAIPLCANVVYSWDIINADNFPEAVAAHGGWYWRGILALLAFPTALALGILATGAVLFFTGTLMYHVFEVGGKIYKWWRRKVEETDKRNLTYED